jgi:hypothetical protein
LVAELLLLSIVVETTSTWILSHHIWALSSATALLEASSHAIVSAVVVVLAHLHASSASSLIVLLESSGLVELVGALEIAVLPPLSLQCTVLLLWIHRIFGLSELFIPVCKMALVSQSAVLMCFKMSASLGLILVVDFRASELRLLLDLVGLLVILDRLRVVVLLLHGGHPEVHMLHLLHHVLRVHILLHAHKVGLDIIVHLYCSLIF